MINNNSRIFYAVGELLTVIPEISLSVNVGINVVGVKDFSPEKGEYERANSERGHELTKHSIPSEPGGHKRPLHLCKVENTGVSCFRKTVIYACRRRRKISPLFGWKISPNEREIIPC